MKRQIFGSGQMQSRDRVKKEQGSTSEWKQSGEHVNWNIANMLAQYLECTEQNVWAELAHKYPRRFAAEMHSPKAS